MKQLKSFFNLFFYKSKTNSELILELRRVLNYIFLIWDYQKETIIFKKLVNENVKIISF